MRFSKLSAPIVFGVWFVAATVLTWGGAPACAATVLAEVRQSGGLMAPNPANTFVVRIHSNGSIFYIHSRVTTGSRFIEVHELVGRLAPAKVRAMAKMIANVQPGELVDENPDAPRGADFPGVDYSVYRRGTRIAIVSQGGDGHTYRLPQSEVSVLQSLLDAAFAIARFRAL